MLTTIERREDPAKGARQRIRGMASSITRIPKISLRTIVSNSNIDPLLDKHDAILTGKLDSANRILAKVGDSLRTALREKLEQKQKAQGKRSIQ